MGILSKLKFWKRHEEEFEMPKPEPLPEEKAGDLGIPGLGERPKAPEMPKFEEPEVAPPPHMREYPAAQPPGAVPSPQLQIIDSKLDAIKAILSALEQRMASLERAAGHEKSIGKLYQQNKKHVWFFLSALIIFFFDQLVLINI